MSMLRSKGSNSRSSRVRTNSSRGNTCPGRQEQHFQEIELQRGQHHRSAIPHHLPGIPVQLDVSHLQGRMTNVFRLALSVGPGAAGNGPDACHQLVWIEGFAQVVVGADLESHDSLHVLGSGRQHDHRDGGFGSDAPQDVESVDAGQHHIQDHQGVIAGKGPFDALLSVVDGVHLKPFRFQVPGDQRTQLGVVIDDQQAIHGDLDRWWAPSTMPPNN